MSDVAIFAIVFGGMFVLRFVAATVVFCWLLPQGDRCEMCDAPTVRLQSTGLFRIMPWFRPSWCYECGWEGTLRTGPTPPAADPTTSVGNGPHPHTRRERRGA